MPDDTPTAPKTATETATATAETAETAELVARFKTAFRRHPAGVAVVTAKAPSGPVGLTASSVASVSADPPALAFSVTSSAGSAGAVLSAPTFMVNLLRSTQAELARAFAVSGAPRFTPDQGWTTLDTGEPVLRGAASALRCRPLRTVTVGGSTLILAEVLEIEHGETGSPLVFHDRTFHALSNGSALA